jgi:hypothetical protein
MERNGAKSTNGSSHTKSKRRIIDPQHDPVFFLPSFPCFSVITTHLAPFFSRLLQVPGAYIPMDQSGSQDLCQGQK